MVGPRNWVFDGKAYAEIEPLVAELDRRGVQNVRLKFPDKTDFSGIKLERALGALHANGKRRVFLDAPRNAIDSLGKVTEFSP